jgi:DtxR family Mn-dependent transcriptional regulator
MPGYESDVRVTRLSQLQYDYLAEIYEGSSLSGKDGFVTTAYLGERMIASQSTVNRAIDRLRDAGLIEHQRYIGVRLTDRGDSEARHILRKQAILETFLVQVMGFSWHEVYDEARRLRHYIGDGVLNRMWEMAGFPRRSPFGEWIAIEGPRLVDSEIPLSAAEIAHDYRIVRVLTREPDRLEYLAALELIPGTRLHLLHKAPFDGPLQIHLERDYRIIGHALACMLMVTPA